MSLRVPFLPRRKAQRGVGGGGPGAPSAGGGTAEAGGGSSCSNPGGSGGNRDTQTQTIVDSQESMRRYGK
eukprot:4985974-Pyramimonas_sp.AAC.1